MHENEIPEVVMCTLSLWDFVIRLRFCEQVSKILFHAMLPKLTTGMDDIRKFDGILDEEDGNIVTDDVPVPFVSVKLDCKSTHISDGVGAPSRA